MSTLARERVYTAIDCEIALAIEKHGGNSAGAPGHELLARFAILAEEYAELAKEVVDAQFVSFTEKPAALERVKGELRQVAAVAVQILESFE